MSILSSPQIANRKINYLFEGDSITAGLFCAPPNDYPTNVYNLLYGGSPTNSTKTNIGTAGISLLTMVANYSTRAGAHFDSTSDLNVLAIMAGTNTSGGSDTTAEQKYALLRSYLRSAQTTGYNRIIVGTMLCRDDDGGTFWTTYAQQFNTYVRTYYNSDLRADALMDFGADSRFNSTAACNNTNFYNTDLLHPKGPPSSYEGCVSMAYIALGPISSVLTGAKPAYVQYPTFSPMDKVSTITLSNSNRTATCTSGSGSYTSAGLPFAKSGKWYWEFTVGAAVHSTGAGLFNESFTNFSGFALGTDTNHLSVGYYQTGHIYLNNVSLVTAATFTAADVVEVAWDATNHLVWFRRNRAGVKQSWNGNGSADPATGVGGIDISTMGTGYIHPGLTLNQPSDACTVSFGASQLTDTPPSGYSAFTP